VLFELKSGGTELFVDSNGVELEKKCVEFRIEFQANKQTKSKLIKQNCL
jgi:hypothetical protein